MGQTGCDVVSIDWRFSLAEARKRLPDNIGLQGNLDPEILFSSPSEIKEATEIMLASHDSQKGYIANLGHGVLKGTPIESVQAFVDTVKE